MSRFYSYINTAKEIISLYKGEEPFAFFLKRFFSANKKYGSKDRKQITHLCYCFFRLGKSSNGVQLEEAILVALFLCADSEHEILAALKPEWNNKAGSSLEDKMALITLPSLLEQVFPWKEQLSADIDSNHFAASFFTQPNLFLRIRKGKKESIKLKLENAGLSPEFIGNDVVVLPNASKIETILDVNKEVVVQDFSSQQTIQLLLQNTLDAASGIRAWDCCAASGGKSILLKGNFPNAVLTVSDVRENILFNLKKRFSEAGIKNYRSIAADLSLKAPFLNEFDLVICDAPCSGSGTWSRTPEQLYFFEERKIEEYARLQKSILQSVMPAIKKGGYLLYITCSVFKKENEGQVAWLQQNFLFSQVEKCLIKGYDKKADTLFVCLLRKE